MKVLILGAKGMLGRELALVFEKYEPVLWDRETIDIRNKKELYDRVLELKPDFIINAAAYTDVDGAESQRDLAMEVNGYAVGFLTRAAAEIDSALCHYSTDYVFDGENPLGYREDDIPGNPVNVYGESKLLSERLLSKMKDRKYFLIRTSWLFGRYGKNFVDTILNLASFKQELKVVRDQFGKPTYAVDLALKTREIVEGASSSGIYHVTNSAPEAGISWYDFAVKIVELAGLPATVIPCTSDEFPRPARRPHYSILQNTKLTSLRPWEEALEAYLQLVVSPSINSG